MREMVDNINGLSVFSKRIKELRKLLKLSQKEFASNVGISTAALSSYETTNKSPSLETVKKIAETYHVSADWLCGVSDNYFIKITNYADIALLLVELINKNILSNIFDTAKHDETALYLSADPITAKFLNDYFKMQSLLLSDTISAEIFANWFGSKIGSLRAQALPNSINFSDLNKMIENDEVNFLGFQGMSPEESNKYLKQRFQSESAASTDKSTSVPLMDNEASAVDPASTVVKAVKEEGDS